MLRMTFLFIIFMLRCAQKKNSGLCGARRLPGEGLRNERKKQVFLLLL